MNRLGDKLVFIVIVLAIALLGAVVVDGLTPTECQRGEINHER